MAAKTTKTKPKTKKNRVAITDEQFTVSDIIKSSAWANVKGIKAKDFIRDLESAKKGERWQEAANFSGFEMSKGVEKGLGKVAIFHSRRTGRKFDISAKLVPKEIKKRDKVILWLVGCCNILDIKIKTPDSAF